MIITQPECVFVALDIKQATRMRRTFISEFPEFFHADRRTERQAYMTKTKQYARFEASTPTTPRTHPRKIESSTIM